MLFAPFLARSKEEDGATCEGVARLVPGVISGVGHLVNEYESVITGAHFVFRRSV